MISLEAERGEVAPHTFLITVRLHQASLKDGFLPKAVGNPSVVSGQACSFRGRMSEAPRMSAPAEIWIMGIGPANDRVVSLPAYKGRLVEAVEPT
ncbi:hypothetical protein [Sphingomonas faeni]|uniref:hypothetical protein n=1 Tax=Sphingomonas faeni TaxID=185950 RepID=UPI0011B22AE8|nr:hypothetical protein [Sphingomonas faeni]